MTQEGPSRRDDPSALRLLADHNPQHDYDKTSESPSRWTPPSIAIDKCCGMIKHEARVWCVMTVPCIIDLARLQAGFVVFTPFAGAPSTACAMNSLPGRGRYGWAGGGMHATMLRVYRIMPCIEHPISGSICAELHGKWNNFKSSFVSSRLAADVISF